MKSCKRASVLISASLDRRLAVRERIALFVHMALCRMCRAYHKQLLFIQSAARSVGDNDEPSAGERLSDDARERLKQRLNQSTR